MRIFNATKRSARFINSAFKLAQLPLSCHHDSCTSKQTKTVNVSFNIKNKEKT
ncbi:Mobile element protein [Candidatus Enterovibrio altilux]|uniref:Mobile element protein n=1 Tax=Candidatus Enterovibrio altilux TaxID=1927128 RepID=A0A291B8Q5_9GAMM|nr:Mobile element protein [Candidatus Enterovibrio luxaltus]